MTDNQVRNPDCTWSEVIPEPIHWGLLPWLWKRLTGWRDEYGRPAQRLTWKDTQ